MIYCQVDRRLAEIEVISDSGGTIKDLPIIVIRSMSFELDDREVINLEFRMPSTSIIKVFNSLKINKESPTTRLRYLKSFTIDSHTPSKCGALGGMKCQTMRCSLTNRSIKSLCVWELNKAILSIHYSRPRN